LSSDEEDDDSKEYINKLLADKTKQILGGSDSEEEVTSSMLEIRPAMSEKQIMDKVAKDIQDIKEMGILEIVRKNEENIEVEAKTIQNT
jgi:hypothetical protein